MDELKMPMVVRQILIQLMITHLANLSTGELRVVDEMFRMLDQYQKDQPVQMPESVHIALKHLATARREYDHAVDELLELAEQYGLIERAAFAEALRIVRLGL